MRTAHLKEQREKLVRKLLKERRRLWIEKRNIPLIKLEKPVRHGWYKEIVLTKQLDKYKIKPECLEIFELLEKHVWARTKKQCDNKWSQQSPSHYVYKDIPTLCENQYSKLSEKAKKLCTPFYFKWNKCNWLRYYVRLPKNAFRVKFTRAYNTHVQMLDPEIESRLDYIENQFLKPGVFEINSWNCWKRDDWSVHRNKKSRLKIRKQLAQFRYTDLITIEEKLWEID